MYEDNHNQPKTTTTTEEKKHAQKKTYNVHEPVLCNFASLWIWKNSTSDLVKKTNKKMEEQITKKKKEETRGGKKKARRAHVHENNLLQCLLTMAGTRMPPSQADPLPPLNG